jgi:transcriptional regulator NrdR family protein
VWTSINDTRSKGTHVQRRRECANGHKFNTEERVLIKKPSAKNKQRTPDDSSSPI